MSNRIIPYNVNYNSHPETQTMQNNTHINRHLCFGWCIEDDFESNDDYESREECCVNTCPLCICDCCYCESNCCNGCCNGNCNPIF